MLGPWLFVSVLALGVGVGDVCRSFSPFSSFPFVIGVCFNLFSICRPYSLVLLF